MDLAREIAEDARKKGDKAREAGAHQDLNDQLDAAQQRGWFGK